MHWGGTSASCGALWTNVIPYATLARQPPCFCENLTVVFLNRSTVSIFIVQMTASEIQNHFTASPQGHLANKFASLFGLNVLSHILRFYLSKGGELLVRPSSRPSVSRTRKMRQFGAILRVSGGFWTFFDLCHSSLDQLFWVLPRGFLAYLMARRPFWAFLRAFLVYPGAGFGHFELIQL